MYKKRRKGGDTKGRRNLLGAMDVFVILIVMTVSHVYTRMSIHMCIDIRVYIHIYM